MKKRYIILFILILIISSGSLLIGRKNQIKTREVVRQVRQSEMKEILDTRELKVVVDYNSTNYFVYKGQPMGFQYELLKAFTNDMGVELNLIVCNNLEETFDGLNKSKFDLVAKNLTVTKERSELVDFTEPFALTREVLVQRNQLRSVPDIKKNPQGKYIHSKSDLARKKVYVQKNTVFGQRLKNISIEIGEPIEVVEDTIYGVEQLISLVATGEIDYTVCDENVAHVNQKYYPWIDVSLALSPDQMLSWAVRKNSVGWKRYIDSWIVNFKKTEQYQLLYRKYYSDFRNTQIRRSEYHSISGGKISEYDNFVRELSASYGWDWRLIASIIMEESGFDKNVRSWSGATGLMQLMPQTAAKFGVSDLSNPRENIRGGMKYLANLNEVFKTLVPDNIERVKFILAAYNVGPGHIFDARNLAIKYKKDPTKWKDNVEPFLIKKAIPKYYRDKEVKWGYCRGEDACSYVRKVLIRYQQYLNVLPAAKDASLAELPVQQLSLR